MQRALFLARRGLGWVEPNPMVGAVVARGRRIIAEGYHRRFGGSHAEIEALRRCASASAGATIYVSLEPCCHTAKTPPCTAALIEAGISRVVVAMRDPDRRVAGRGIARLRAAGITVEVGAHAQEARQLNRAYIFHRKEKLPYVVLKWAQTDDGYWSRGSGRRRWISSPQARRDVHKMRARSQAIMVGIGTVIADDPLLTARSGGRQPLRVVLDSRLRIPLKCNLVRTAKRYPLLVVTSMRAMETTKRLTLERQGVRLLKAPLRNGLISPMPVLKQLAQDGICTLLVEGGPTLAQSLLRRGCVNEICVYRTRDNLGDKLALPRLDIDEIEEKHPMKEYLIVTMGKNTKITAMLRRTRPLTRA